MLPSHGAVYATYLLARSAQLGPRADVAAWLESSRAVGGFLGAATNLERVVRFLVTAGLAEIGEERVTISPELPRVAAADRGTLLSIASTLLRISPPIWLSGAVSGGILRRHYVPTQAMQSLAWLEPDLEALLLGAATFQRDDWLADMGLLGELVLLECLKCMHTEPVHVATISAAYGYDIRARRPSERWLEVKTATQSTAGSFHLSRNEFEVAVNHPDVWELHQVVVKSAALTVGELRASDVLTVRSLPVSALQRLSPQSDCFKWEGSGVFTPADDDWLSSDIQVAADLHVRLPER